MSYRYEDPQFVSDRDKCYQHGFISAMNHLPCLSVNVVALIPQRDPKLFLDASGLDRARNHIELLALRGAWIDGWLDAMTEYDSIKS
jgi:hypothetical protein